MWCRTLRRGDATERSDAKTSLKETNVIGLQNIWRSRKRTFGLSQLCVYTRGGGGTWWRRVMISLTSTSPRPLMSWSKHLSCACHHVHVQQNVWKQNELYPYSRKYGISPKWSKKFRIRRFCSIYRETNDFKVCDISINALTCER